MSSVGPWTLNEVLGTGTTATVYAAKGPDGSGAAAKLLTSPNVRTVELADEIWIMAQLDHPNIVELLDWGRVTDDEATNSGGRLQAGAPYLIMERGDGTLGGAHRPKDWPGVRRFLDDVLGALAHAHAMQVIHRDLKPSNILAFHTDSGVSWKLADLGIAHALDHHDPDDRMMRSAGTPLYMAPEQLANQWRDLGPWTDLYAVGCLVWEMITGAPPFTGNTLIEVVQGHLLRRLPNVSPSFDVPTHVETWLQQLLQKRTTDRFMRVSDAIAALEKRDEHAGAPAEWRAQQITPTKPRFSRGRALFGPRAVRLIRREQEQQSLWQHLRQAQADQTARIVVLAGPGGIGKTHLADWLMRRAHELGAGWMLRAQHHLPASPQDGIGPMVAELLRCVDMAGKALTDRLVQILSDMDFDDLGLVTAVQGLLEGTGPVEVRIAILQAMLHLLCAGAPGDGTVQRVALLSLDNIQHGDDALSLVQTWSNAPPVGFASVILIPVNPEELSASQLAILQHPAVHWMTLERVELDHPEAPLDGLVDLRLSLQDPFWRAENRSPTETDAQLREWLTRTLADNGSAKTLWEVVRTADREGS